MEIQTHIPLWLKATIAGVFFLLCALLLPAQTTEEFPYGKVIDSVVLKDNSGDSYALFLPEDYIPSTPAPVLFVFDPAARGSLGVHTFRETVGSKGWIIVCSNVSKNGPYEKNFQQANSLFSDVFSRFSIDPDRIFVAGFSGGARLATTLAVLSEQIRGVIACGATFSPNAGQMPLPGASFAFAGIVGTRDMNYQELWKAGEWLDRIDLPHRLIFYDGPHRWPPEAQLSRAIDWMIMETQGPEGSDTSLIERAYERDRYIADTLLVAGRFFESHWEYSQLLKNYKFGVVPDSIPEFISQMERKKAFKKQQKVFDQIGQAEEGLRQEFSERFHSEREQVPPSIDSVWWSKKLLALEKKYGESELVVENNMYARMLNQLFAMPIEASEGYRRKGNIEGSLYCNTLLTVLFKENPRFWIRKAEDLAQLQRPEEMLEMLETAKKLGYTDAVSIHNNPLFERYRGIPGFPF